MSKGKDNYNNRGMNWATPDGYIECPLVFISAPWNDETEEYPSWMSGVCRMALQEGCLPVAPFGMYSSLFGNMPRRGFVVSVLVQTLLSACREVWVFDDENGRLSENQAQEMIRAMEFDKPIRHFCMKEGLAQ